MPKEWLAIVNPVSGANKNQRRSRKIINHLVNQGFNLEVKLTYDRGSAIHLAKESIEEGFRNIIVIGGDGTLNEVVNGIFLQQAARTTDIKLGMFSLGTGNDFIRTFQIPCDYETATEILMQGKTQTIDVGIVRYHVEGKPHVRYFVNVLGMAFDGAVTESANSTKGAIGKLTYLKSVVATLFKYEPTKMKVEVDDKPVADDIVFCMNVGNCKYSGGGMRMVPDAIPDDGLFDITIMKPLANMKAITNLHRLFNGTIYKLEEAAHLRGKKIKVSSEPPICAEAEGEYLGDSPFEVEIIPASLNLFVP
jgi:YegS/Rv2252/BmrU family lipid kinase